MARATLEQRLEKISQRRSQSCTPCEDPELNMQVEEFALRRRDALRLAEKILMARAPEVPDSAIEFTIRGFFTLEELDVIDSIPWTAKELSKEAARCKQVIHLQQSAGTSDDRMRDAASLEAAEAAVTERAPVIESEIRKLTAELTGLRRDRDQAAGVVAAQTNAVARLREFVPAHVKERHRRAVASLTPLRVELGELVAKLNTSRSIAAIDIAPGLTIATMEQIRLHCQSSVPELFQTGVRHDELDVNSWLEYQKQRAAEIPELESRVAELRSKLHELEVEAADTYLDVYAAR